MEAMILPIEVATGDPNLSPLESVTFSPSPAVLPIPTIL